MSPKGIGRVVASRAGDARRGAAAAVDVRARFAALYLTALLWGAFGALVASPDVLTVGASGAVFGLMGAAYFEMRARGIDPWQTGIGPLIAFNLIFTFLVGGISIGGHIGGLIGGAIAGYAMEFFAQRRGSTLPGIAACVILAVAAVAGSFAVA